MSEVRHFIRKARMKAGMSQVQLAVIIGVQAGTVYQWEAGRRCPDFDTLQRIASVTHMTLVVGTHTTEDFDGIGVS